MFILVRHLLAVAALPFMMAVVVPAWIARGSGLRLHVANTPLEILTQVIGAILLVIGAILFVSSLRRFAGDGKGTLAPWDPPRALVVTGPYRYVRNPMISGVVFILFAEAAVLLSIPLLEWALTFLMLNFIYIPLLEEPGLERRFGESYREYCRNVPRLIPRLRPWTGQRVAEQ